VKFPTLKEQIRIADFYEVLDKKAKIVAEQIKQTQSFKKGLLQQMFV
jgi:type I restriction enzyme S subunit